jgi:16S rRNA (cytosine1402-N4)-methyltransferase
MAFRHIPVLTEEVMSLLRCEPGRIYVDGTLGGGGHSFEILKRTSPDGTVIGVEWDEEALLEARKTLMEFGPRAKIYRENFINLPRLLKSVNIEQVDGILLDLGLSSLQLAKGERGFSLKEEGPLDMRMDQRLNLAAADLVNQLDEKELEDTLAEYGEERWARRIASVVCEERRRGPIQTTQVLRKIVHQAIPRRFHSRKIDPATRTFQALRIRVNNELENLKGILETGWKLLKKGGRICVISFHSLEDRIVKETFRKLEREGSRPGPEGELRVVTKKPVVPSAEERKRNPRSRSAKLRCAEKL